MSGIAAMMEEEMRFFIYLGTDSSLWREHALGSTRRIMAPDSDASLLSSGIYEK